MFFWVKKTNVGVRSLVFLNFDTFCDVISDFLDPEWPKISIFVKNGGSRSIIWIKNYFDRFYL